MTLYYVIQNIVQQRARSSLIIGCVDMLIEFPDSLLIKGVEAYVKSLISPYRNFFSTEGSVTCSLHMAGIASIRSLLWPCALLQPHIELFLLKTYRIEIAGCHIRRR